MRRGRKPDLGYVIAAYALVVGSLVAYGLSVELQRRALMRRDPERSGSAGAGSETDPANS